MHPLAKIAAIFIVQLSVLVAHRVRVRRQPYESSERSMLSNATKHKMSYDDVSAYMMQKQMFGQYCSCLRAFRRTSSRTRSFKRPAEVAQLMDSRRNAAAQEEEFQEFNREFGPSQLRSMTNDSDTGVEKILLGTAELESPSAFEQTVLDRIVVPLVSQESFAARAEHEVQQEEEWLNHRQRLCEKDVQWNNARSILAAEQILGCCHDILTSRLSPLAARSEVDGTFYRTIRMQHSGRGDPVVEVVMTSAGPDAMYKITFSGREYSGRALVANGWPEQRTTLGGAVYLMNVLESGKNAEIVLQGTAGTDTDGYCVVRDDGRIILQPGKNHSDVASVEAALEGSMYVFPVSSEASGLHGSNTERCHHLDETIVASSQVIHRSARQPKGTATSNETLPRAALARDDGDTGVDSADRLMELPIDKLIANASPPESMTEMMQQLTEVGGEIDRGGEISDAWLRESPGAGLPESQLPEFNYDEYMLGVHERMAAKQVARRHAAGWRSSTEAASQDLSYEAMMADLHGKVEARNRERRTKHVQRTVHLPAPNSMLQLNRIPYYLRRAFNLLWGLVRTLAYAVKYVLSLLIQKVLLLGFLKDLTNAVRRMSRDPAVYMFLPRAWSSFKLQLRQDFREIGTGRPFYRLCCALGSVFGMGPSAFARQALKPVGILQQVAKTASAPLYMYMFTGVSAMI